MSDEEGDAEEGTKRRLRLKSERAVSAIDLGKQDGPPLKLPGESTNVAKVSTIPPWDDASPQDGWQSNPPPAMDDPRSVDLNLDAPAVVGGVADLIGRSVPTIEEQDLETEMVERFALGDFSRALQVAELVLGQEAGNVEASRVVLQSRARLIEMHLSALGGEDQKLHVHMDSADIRWMGLDPQAMQLLAAINGQRTVAEVLRISALPQLDGLKLLRRLIELAVVAAAQ